MGTLDPLRDARAGNSVRSFGHRGALPALAILVGRWTALRRRDCTGAARPSAPAVWGTSLTAIARTANTSQRFAADLLDMAGAAEPAAMFGDAGLALFATALRCGMRHEGAQ